MSVESHLFRWTDLLEEGGRDLQPQIPPDYTSPPLSDALDATPEEYRGDGAIDAARAVAAAGNCTADGNRCHIPFAPPAGLFEEGGKVGVIFYGGGFVDPRGYSPLALTLADRYGLPVVVPIFNQDLAFTFGVCDSGRLDLAQAEFEDVEKWVLAGHSFGGTAAMSDMWTRYNSATDAPVAAGLAMIASDIQNVGCGDVDFSSTNIPMASISASLDLILNATRSEINKRFLSNATQFLDIYGGNHGQFGSYDDSERTPILGQVDGDALIPPQVQWELTTASIYHVASRTGVELPQRIKKDEVPPDCRETSAACCAFCVASPSSWLLPVFLSVTLLLKIG
jgi:hypothetical protein